MAQKLEKILKEDIFCKKKLGKSKFSKEYKNPANAKC